MTPEDAIAELRRRRYSDTDIVTLLLGRARTRQIRFAEHQAMFTALIADARRDGVPTVEIAKMLQCAGLSRSHAYRLLSHQQGMEMRQKDAENRLKAILHRLEES